MRSPIARVVDAFIGNPFDVLPRARLAAAEVIAATDVGAEVRQLVDDGEVENAKLLLLAVGHWQACDRPDDATAVLGPATVPRAVWQRMPRARGAYLRVAMAAGRCHRALTAIRGASHAMNRVRRDTWAACFGDSLRHALELERVIRDHDVLLLGETGTGKEAVARAIQLATLGDDSGARAPMAAINAATVPETLIESALFGHVKGAFTGAQETRMGRLRTAHGGSFFLDEVGDLPPTTQIKLLRVMETNDVYPLGSDEPAIVDVRYVAATHKDLERMVEDGEFRRDLFQRLAGNVICIPPLRERPDDMVEIGVSFVRDYFGEGRLGAQIAAIEGWLQSDEAREYAWLGNVRELQNALRNLMLGLDPGIGGASDGLPDDVDASLPPDLRACEATLEEATDWYLQRVLAHCDGNFTQASRILGVDRSTVRRRISAIRSSR